MHFLLLGDAYIIIHWLFKQENNICQEKTIFSHEEQFEEKIYRIIRLVSIWSQSLMEE